MVKKITTIISAFICILVIFQVQDAHSRAKDYQLIKIEKISRYFEDRVVFQHIEKKPVEHVFDKVDNSIASLLIIKDKNIYLFKDGFDDPFDVKETKIKNDLANKLIPDMWTNKIDSSPDYVRITERRIEKQKNVNKEWVGKNYKDFYIKVRDAFIKKHVAIFLSLVINRKESGLITEKIPIPKKISDSGPTRYALKVMGKTLDEKVYLAEDADGDGITETFTVHLADGFHWGFHSGPNLITIYNNSQKDIEAMIGRLTNQAFYGTPEEEAIIKKSFPTADNIKDIINDIHKIDKDSEIMLKKNNIDIEKNVEERSKSGGTSTDK